MAEARTLKQLADAADAAMKTGDADRAIALYMQVLAKAPGHSKAKKAMQRLKRSHAGQPVTQADADRALALLKAGRTRDAAALCRRLILAAPNEALLHNILGMALAAAGDGTAAIAGFRQALRLKPDWAEAEANLGLALFGAGAIDQAADHLGRAVSRNPKLGEAWNTLALVHMNHGDLAAAIGAADTAVAISPADANTLNTRGLILRALKREDAAIACFRKAQDSAPGHVPSLRNLAEALAATGLHAEAIALLEHTATGSVVPVRIRTQIAELMAQIGQRDQAVERLHAVIDDHPDAAEACRILSMLHRFKPGDPLIPRMQARWKMPDLADDQRMHLGFALGKALEDTGDHDTAFACLQVANTLRRKALPAYSTASNQQWFNRIVEVFTPEFAAAASPAMPASAKPVFIVGMNRSGTTLLEQILASHSQMAGAGELADVDEFGITRLQSGDAIDLNDLASFATRYLGKLDRIDANAVHVVDKMPVNFCWIGLIRAAFPGARILHMVRDPRDTCLSNYKNYFSSNAHQYTYDLVELAEYYAQYDAMMRHWHAKFPGAILDCSYQALTGDLRAEAGRVLAFLGLEWEDALQNFQKTERSVATASLGQVRSALYQSSVGAWQRFEAQLVPLTETLARHNLLPE